MTRRKLLSILLSMSLAVTSITGINLCGTEKANAESSDVTVDFDESKEQEMWAIPLSVRNDIAQSYYKSSGEYLDIRDIENSLLRGETKTITWQTSGSDTDSKFSASDITVDDINSTTFCGFDYDDEGIAKTDISNYTDYVMTQKISGRSISFKNISYSGDKTDVKLDIPDLIHYCGYTVTSTSDTDDNGVKTTEYTLQFSPLFTGYVTSIETAFNSHWVDNSTCITMSISVPKRVTDIAASAFKGNTKIKNIEFDAPNISTVGKDAFSGCNKLQSLDLASLKSALATIPDNCFYQCNSLENIEIPETTLNIGKNAFYQCDKINFLLVPKAVQTIGQMAFGNCSNLRYLYIASTYSDWTKAKIVDNSELYKLITGDISKPIVSTKIGGGSVGENVYSGGDLYVYSPVDIVSCSVTRDGESIDVNKYTSQIYPLGNGTKYSTNAYNFDASKKGVYFIIAKDVMGNEIKKTVNYNSDIEDSTPPTISGVTGSMSYSAPTVTCNEKETYFISVTVTYNGTTVEKLNGDGVKEFTLKPEYFNLDGEYTITVTDLFNNKTSVTFYVDTAAPTITTSVKENDVVSKAVSLTVSDVDVKYNTDNAINFDNIYKDLSYPTLNTNIKDTDTGYLGSGIAKVMLDNTDVTSSLTATEGMSTSSGLKKGTLAVTNSGKHTVTVVDCAGNSTSLNFTIDATGPQLKGIENNAYYNKNVKLEYVGTAGVASQCALVSYTSTDNKKSNKYYDDGDVLTKDGKYSVRLTDKANSKTTYSFVIDKTAPKIVGVKNKGCYKESPSVEVTDDNFSYMTVNKTKYTGKKFSPKKDGKYTIIAYDKAGNKSKTVKIVYDTKAPKCNVKAKTYKGKVKITCSDKLSGIKKITVDKKKVKNKKVYKKRGKHTLKVWDKAGNTKTVKFRIK